MRTNLRVAAVLALGISSSIVACSSSDDPSSPAPDTTDSGSTSSSSGSSGASSGSSGTSGTSGGPTDAAADSADAADANVAFALTSTAFTEGTAIPLAQAQNCTGGGKKINGSDESPPLAWTSGPAGTSSYAVELHDATNNLVHAVTFDIPAALRALPGKISHTNQLADFTPNPPGGGVKQAKNISNTFGYAGPCPPNQHTYEFILYAVDVATLPNATATTTKEDIVAALKMHTLATTKLTGTFTP